MNEPIEEREVLWNTFLDRWPIERLALMTLPDYAQAGSQDGFTYWLESKTESLGSIWGGSSFKFGVYARKDRSDKQAAVGKRYGEIYGWLEKYGNTPEEAFEAVRSEIVKVAESARAGALSNVDLAQLGPTLKWKIAFLYQDRITPSVLPIYKAEFLQAVLKTKEKNASRLHAQLIEGTSARHIFKRGDEVWAKIQSIIASELTTEAALEYLETSERFSPIKPATRKIAGYQTIAGSQLALALDNKDPTIYLCDGNWITLVEAQLGKVVRYEAEKSRSSNLVANAPQLAEGNAIVKANVPTMLALIALCDAYDERDLTPDYDGPPSITSHTSKSAASLNQILFGPPGTGKTFETINAALDILDPAFLIANGAVRTALKQRFDELIRDERIRFVTFHQSFSYEDFVEGLRAEIDDETGQLRYRIEDGVFKQLCNDALELPATKATLGIGKSPHIWKISIDGVHKSATRQYCFQHGEARIGWGHVGDLETANLDDPAHQLGPNDKSCLRLFSQEIQLGDVLLCKRSNMEIGAIGIVTSEYRFEPETPPGILSSYNHVLSVNWMLIDIQVLIGKLNGGKGLTMKTVYELDRIKWLDLVQALYSAGHKVPGSSALREAEEVSKPFVLIIDEINRGSVSRIFGELITLIEPSKRRGADEALEVVLPYSKSTFSIPRNVYLIGTMNTADRSLAGLDIALRRRFTFREMPPRPDMLQRVEVGGVNIGLLLNRMNQRIEVLLDRDHCLGHTYLLPLRKDPSLSSLATIFRQQIVPLLQEYFFEDWERIHWVLNDHRKAPEYRFISPQTNSISTLFGSDAGLGKPGTRWILRHEAFDCIESYAGVIEV